LAKILVNWTTTDLISVAEVADQLGFDLRKYDFQSAEVQAGMQKAIVDRIIHMIRQSWRDAFDPEPHPSVDFNAIRNGVYVIAIGDGFGVRYPKGTSEVMYIGRGAIANRLRSHLNNWIFEMSRSLKDVSFRFYMEMIGDGRSKGAFKDFEHFMLDGFHAKFGDKPLLNKIHGRAGTIDHAYEGKWNLPLDNRGKTYLWEINPTKKNRWFKQYEDK